MLFGSKPHFLSFHSKCLACEALPAHPGNGQTAFWTHRSPRHLLPSAYSACSALTFPLPVLMPKHCLSMHPRTWAWWGPRQSCQESDFGSRVWHGKCVWVFSIWSLLELKQKLFWKNRLRCLVAIQYHWAASFTAEDGPVLFCWSLKRSNFPCSPLSATPMWKKQQ